MPILQEKSFAIQFGIANTLRQVLILICTILDVIVYNRLLHQSRIVPLPYSLSYGLSMQCQLMNRVNG